MSQAKNLKESCPSKKKKSNHKEGSKKTPRTREPSCSKGREAKNVSKTLHPRMEDDYNRMLEHFRQEFVGANCDATVIGPNIAECHFVEDATV